jgi:hypothetical protein
MGHNHHENEAMAEKSNRMLHLAIVDGRADMMSTIVTTPTPMIDEPQGGGEAAANEIQTVMIRST